MKMKRASKVTIDPVDLFIFLSRTWNNLGRKSFRIFHNKSRSIVKPKMRKKGGDGQFGAFQSGEEETAGFKNGATVVLLGELLTRMQSSYRRC
jgi:hypothetical protein